MPWVKQLTQKHSKKRERNQNVIAGQLQIKARYNNKIILIIINNK